MDKIYLGSGFRRLKVKSEYVMILFLSRRLTDFIIKKSYTLEWNTVFLPFHDQIDLGSTHMQTEAIALCNNRVIVNRPEHMLPYKPYKALHRRRKGSEY